MISQIIANNIMWITKMHGIDIYVLERDIGLSRGYISRCRSGKRKLSVDCVMGFINFFDNRYSMESLIINNYEKMYKEVLNEFAEKIKSSGS